jgi:KUP system potassium uptake protein
VIDDLGYADDGITHLSAVFGYMENPNIPGVLALAAEAELEAPVDLNQLSYFLSRIEIGMGDAPGMARWRKRLFIATSHLTADAAEYFALRREQTVVMGSRIEI